MKLFAIHHVDFVTVIVANSIHTACQIATGSNGVNLVSQINREDPIEFSRLDSATKQWVLIDFETSKNESLRIAYRKESQVDSSILLKLLIKHNPLVWFNFSNGVNGAWCIQTQKEDITYNEFGQEVCDYLKSI